MIADLFNRLDRSEGLARARQRAAGVLARVCWWTENGCVALCVLGLLTFSLAGFDLVRAARLWGGFWTHFAAASPHAREPVVTVMAVSWAAATFFIAWIRYRPAARGPRSAVQGV